MEELGDGHVVQGGMNYFERSSRPGDAVKYIPHPVKGQVLATYEIDTEENGPGETTLCDIHCTDLGIDLFKVPFSLNKASVDNYVHFGPVPASGNVDKSPFDQSRLKPKVSNGDTVVVVFINGAVHEPVIIACFPHNQSGWDGVCPDPRPGVDDGDIIKVRYNGTGIKVDKNGNIDINSLFPALDKLVSKNKKLSLTWKDPAKNQSVLVEFDNTLNNPKAVITVTKEDGKKQKFELLGQSNTTRITCEHNAGTNKIELTPSGMNVQVKGNLTESIDGNTNRSVTGTRTENITGDQTDGYGANYNINVSGNCKITAGGNVEVTGAQIKLNGSAGDVLTTVTDPVVDMIVGVPTMGVPTVKSG